MPEYAFAWSEFPPIMGPGATTEVSDISGFVKDTGGIEFNVTNPLSEVQPISGARVDPEKLESTAEAAYAFARTYYRVALEVSEPIQKPRQLTLEVLDQQRRRALNENLGNWAYYAAF
jgi:hypothetical protein